MALLDTMKKIAAQTGEVTVPAAFLFGVVTSVEPLTVRVDNRFDLSGEAVVLMREFRAGAYPTHTHTVAPHGHTVPAHQTQAADAHTHGVAAVQTQPAGSVTEQETYAGLAVGDKVVLFRNQGGQQFLVLGRL